MNDAASLWSGLHKVMYFDGTDHLGYANVAQWCEAMLHPSMSTVTGGRILTRSKNRAARSRGIRTQPWDVAFAYADNRGAHPNRAKKPSTEVGEMAGDASRFRELSRAALPAPR